MKQSNPELPEPGRPSPTPAFHETARRRMVRLFVPRWIGREAESIGKELLHTGFASADEELLHFRYDLTKTTA